MIVSTIREGRDRSELLCVKDLFATCTSLKTFPAQVAKNLAMTLQNSLNSFTNSFHLFASFRSPCFQNKLDELFKIPQLDLFWCTVCAKLNLGSVWKDRGKVLVDSGIKDIFWQLGTISPQVVQHLVRVTVDRVEIT